MKGIQGTYQFCPPEAFDSESLTISGVKQDVWALGVTLYAMIYNKLPFSADNERELEEQITHYPLDIDGEDSSQRVISSNLREILEGTLEKDADQRWSLEQIISKLAEDPTS